MRRRLDLASALVHEPRVLFLDEPTTGLDPVSRKAIWEEVEDLNDEGTTVFLTTQYLEEADQLADRVGIIDERADRRRGHARAAEGADRPAAPRARAPRRRVRERGRGDRAAASASRCRERTAACSSSSSGGAAEVAPVVRALDEAGLGVESLDLVEPTLDDVFVAKTGRHLEGAEDARGRRGARVIARRDLRVIGALGARSVKQTFRRPQLLAPIVVFPTLLLAVQTGGAGRAVDLPGFPQVNSFLDFMLAGAMIQSTLLAGNSGGIALAVDIEMGFTDRLLAAPISRFAIVLGRLAGTAAPRRVAALWFLAIGLIFGAHIKEGVPGRCDDRSWSPCRRSPSAGSAPRSRCGPASASVVQGLFPLVFVILFLSVARSSRPTCCSSRRRRSPSTTR